MTEKLKFETIWYPSEHTKEKASKLKKRMKSKKKRKQWYKSNLKQ